MNREIKFRAWDGESKEMHYWTLNDLLCRFGEKDYANDNTASPFFNWMQYTGLKDKNGREIFEGDIVQGRYNQIFLVEYFKDGFWLNGGQQGAERNLSHIHENIKIIGNIYENFELLKQ